MIKICVVVASRANYGRIRSVMRAIKNDNRFELVVVVSASAVLYRYGNVSELIEQDGFEIDSRIYTIVEGGNTMTMAKSTGLSIIELSSVFDRLKPDMVVTVADRYETLATATAAAYMNIPVVHTQGGDLSGSIDESVRNAITKLSHIHFPATELSRTRILKMGENQKNVFNFGCPAMDEIDIDAISSIGDFDINAFGTGDELNLSEKYLVLIEHPITTDFDKHDKVISKSISALEKLDMQVVVLWPNVDAGSDTISKTIRILKEKNNKNKMRFIRNLEIVDYNRLIYNSECLIGNSSSGIREAAFLGLPSVNVGDRQIFREKGSNVISVPNSTAEIIDATLSQINHGRYERDFRFGKGDAGKRIADKLATIGPIQIQKEWHDGAQ